MESNAGILQNLNQELDAYLNFVLGEYLLKPETSRLEKRRSREDWSGREWTRTIDLTDVNPVV